MGGATGQTPSTALGPFKDRLRAALGPFKNLLRTTQEPDKNRLIGVVVYSLPSLQFATKASNSNTGLTTSATHFLV